MNLGRTLPNEEKPHLKTLERVKKNMIPTDAGQFGGISLAERSIARFYPVPIRGTRNPIDLDLSFSIACGIINSNH